MVQEKCMMRLETANKLRKSVPSLSVRSKIRTLNQR